MIAIPTATAIVYSMGFSMIAGAVVRSPVVVDTESVVGGTLVQTVVVIEPGDMANMSRLDAFQRTQARTQNVRSSAGEGVMMREGGWVGGW